MSTKAYTSLLNEPVIWMLTPHGDGYALGWRGSPEARELCFNLFANFYTPPNGQSPAHIQLNENVSYIYTSDVEAIRRTLTLYFNIHAIRDEEVNIKRGWTEDDCIYEPDEVKAAQLGTEAAEAFLSHIKHVGFIPSLPKPYGDVFTLGKLVGEESSWVEYYASAASS